MCPVDMYRQGVVNMWTLYGWPMMLFYYETGLITTRGSVGWACVAHLPFCFEETLYRTFQISINLAKWFYRRLYLIGQSQTRTAYDGHTSCMISTKYGNFVQDLPYIISNLLQSNNSLCLLVSEEIFCLIFSQSETRIVHGDQIFVQSGWNERIF